MTFSIRTLASFAASVSIALTIGTSVQANDLLETGFANTGTSAPAVASAKPFNTPEQSALISFNEIGGVTMSDYTNSGLAGLKFKMLDVMSPKTDLFSDKDRPRFSSNRTYIQANLKQSDIKINDGLKHFNLASFTISNNQLIKGQKSELFGEKVLETVTGLTLVK
jgi:hypothetical protein